ncbi:MAG TPA: hypothetical protein VMR37_08140, partial [Rhabdochlamydiaceae bacterium]|nr:hypothetical protein [Rhabdochlamydiaceae bacterium]
NGQSDPSWDLITIAELTHRVSFLFLTALSLAPYFKGIDHVSPLFTIFFTTLYLGSHFVFYEDKKNAPTVVLFREYIELAE